MSWIILEGLDRTGKSTVAKLYEEQGYRIIHMNAPDKKYSEKGYVGPGYVDELIELYLDCSGEDIVFDRSPYGEIVWPEVYDRAPQLSEEDFEALIEMEEQNQTERILMCDKDVAGHWQRCLDNKEPLSRAQFAKARTYFDKMADQYNFQRMELDQFHIEENKEELDTAEVEESAEKPRLESKNKPSPTAKLEKANALNSVLSKKIIRNKGTIYEQIEADVRGFLTEQLNTLLGGESRSFTEDEVQILKLYCQRIKQKAEGNK